MIIFGTRGVTGTKQKGTFHCPQCGTESDFAKKRVRRFFTLYFIPLIPLDKLGEYVECSNCEGTFQLNVLDYDPAEESQKSEALFMVAMKQVMIAILLADGVIDDEEVKALQSTFQELSGVEIAESDLREEIDSLQGSQSDPLELVSSLAGGLNDFGKEKVIRAAYGIAAADGVVSSEESEMMIEIGKALELTPTHYKGILAELRRA